ncbi:MAG: tetratricopeptide repeat protein [Sphingomicrobium sp.]|nr:cytochrome C biosynthesis protein [Sphingomonadales bacterium]
MSGFVILLALIALTLGLLWLLKLRGPMLTLAAAALAFGGAGYVLQGSPGLIGSPRSRADEPPPLPLANARHVFFGTFTPAERWLILSDSYARTGDTMSAAQLVQSAIRAHPDDAELWVGLGNALVDHARALTPAARVAYYHAIELAPQSAAPRFFLGLALMRSGDRPGALAEWQAIIAHAPPSAGWRPMVEEGVTLLQSRER